MPRIFGFQTNIALFRFPSILFLAHCMIDSTFDRLQSVKLNECTPEQFVMLLFCFKSLPQLSSLTTTLIENEFSDLGNIYRMIFSLPTLKYNKLTLDSSDGHKQFFNRTNCRY